MRSKVDFPAPLGPSTAMNSPSSKAKLAPCHTGSFEP
jgi:hypothetical protein